MNSVGSFLAQSGVSMLSTRTESQMANAVRLAQYPDGRQVLQGAYQWTEGFNGGIVWRDLPVIMVGMSGQGLQDD
jgi:hypothetical protein